MDRYRNFMQCGYALDSKLNFNTGESEGVATGSRVAMNTSEMARTRPSHAVLPITPVGGAS